MGLGCNRLNQDSLAIFSETFIRSDALHGLGVALRGELQNRVDARHGLGVPCGFGVAVSEVLLGAELLGIGTALLKCGAAIFSIGEAFMNRN